jgi:GxxExxY protein
MALGDTTDPETERVASIVLDAIYAVYERLGPGLLESVYETCLEYELKKRGLTVLRQHPIPICYDEIELEAGFRIDLLVNHLVIIELKAVEKLIPVFEAQLMTYLRLSGKRVGFLVNFNAKYLKDQLLRRVM